MGKPRKPSVTALHEQLAKIARQYVNYWIDSGMLPEDMFDCAMMVNDVFCDELKRNVDLYATTGKYPQYADQDQSKKGN